jgi:hypothetical protein
MGKAEPQKIQMPKIVKGVKGSRGQVEKQKSGVRIKMAME